MREDTKSLQLADVISALDTTLTTLKATGIDLTYRVGGTSAALLQGVHLPVGDIDVLVAQRTDVDAVATALSPFPCLHATSWLPQGAQYFARYEVNGVHLEISTVEQETESDALECIDSGPWHHYVQITCGQHPVPVVRLELRLATELLRDRPDRYKPLLDHLATHGFDADLLNRAMVARDIPLARQRSIHNRLMSSR
ncbi:hypothetical protein ACIBG8_38140 [Nonomuraea sp. NPDC050556]|uniref:hypothetical protein n=1 Tax=Nonomuraea sp. NPDC050556 TaxID=3364369 RepID=UPI0037A4E380